MNVRELIAALQEFDPDQPVHIAYNYGDHWHTRVAPEIKRVEEEAVRMSGYHNMPAIVDADEDVDEEARRLDVQAVIVVQA